MTLEMADEILMHTWRAHGLLRSVRTMELELSHNSPSPENLTAYLHAVAIDHERLILAKHGIDLCRDADDDDTG